MSKKSKPVDGGAGISVTPPQSNAMKFYRQVQESGCYDENGNPEKTGEQSKKLPGHGDSSDPTKGRPIYRGEATPNSKNPKSKVSAKIKKVHKLTKGMGKS